MGGLSSAFSSNFMLFAAAGVLILIMLGLIINLYVELSTIKTRYKRMMEGSEGESIEQMLSAHTSAVNEISDSQRQVERKLEAFDELVKTSLARVAVVHFDAFEKTGQGLSWCMAMLDRNNNGVILSSICGQESERSYVKPIEEGRVAANYKLTREEEQALRQAMSQ